MTWMVRRFSTNSLRTKRVQHEMELLYPHEGKPLYPNKENADPMLESRCRCQSQGGEGRERAWELGE